MGGYLRKQISHIEISEQLPPFPLNPLESTRGRQALFALLYASEGAPIGFIWWALPTLLRQEGVAIEAITGLTAVLVLPWVGKFLWAPLIDLSRTPRWGLRAWIITAQALMGLTLVPLLWLDPVGHLQWWKLLLLAHGFSAATQDVAIDALAINTVPAAERGRLNGVMQAGMLAGRSLFGGGALLLTGYLGRNGMILALIAMIWSTLTLVLLVREPESANKGRAWREFLGSLAAIARRRATWIGLGFALAGAAGFEAAGALAGPYLVDRGVSTETIGWFFGMIVVGAMVAGGLLGGKLADRHGAARVVMWSIGGFTGALFLLAAVDGVAGLPQAVRLGLLGLMYGGVGVFTAASYALFMHLTEPRLGGTQFSTFMAATNGCESWSAAAGGQLAAGPGYPAAFVTLSLVSLLTLPLLFWLRRHGAGATSAENPAAEPPRGRT